MLQAHRSAVMESDNSIPRLVSETDQIYGDGVTWKVDENEAPWWG